MLKSTFFCRRPGFTLVELVVVILILGILAGMATAHLMGLSRETAINATISDIQIAQDAIMRYQIENGSWPRDKIQGRFPPELKGYLSKNLFKKEVPIGGKYDWNHNYGFTAAMSVWQNPPDLPVWIEIDRRLDDGSLNTGKIRRKNMNLNFQLEP